MHQQFWNFKFQAMLSLYLLIGRISDGFSFVKEMSLFCVDSNATSRVVRTVVLQQTRLVLTEAAATCRRVR